MPIDTSQSQSNIVSVNFSEREKISGKGEKKIAE